MSRSLSFSNSRGERQDRGNIQQYGLARSARAQLPRPSSGLSQPENPGEPLRTVFRTKQGTRRARSRQDLSLPTSCVTNVGFVSIWFTGFTARSAAMWGLGCGGWGAGGGAPCHTLPPQTPWCNENPQNLTVSEKSITKKTCGVKRIP